MTTATLPSRSPLRLPRATPIAYERNFVRAVHFEIRFPTLLELENGSPSKIQNALRRDFPFYSQGMTLNVQPGGVEKIRAHQLRSRDKRWQIGVTASSIAITTESYRGFEDLQARVEHVYKRVLPTLDTDFLTRVGLRYQNVLPVTQGNSGGWLSEPFGSVLGTGYLGEVQQCWQVIQGTTNWDGGGYTVQHGVQASFDGNYQLDMDFFAENVDAARVVELMVRMHETAFDFFSWAIGPKAKEHLGPGRPKG